MLAGAGLARAWKRVPAAGPTATRGPNLFREKYLADKQHCECASEVDAAQKALTTGGERRG